jgi:N-acetylglutamate synthase-like GNAT family acetyltransferase
MRSDDLDAVDSILRLAFGTSRGLPDPSVTFGDADTARTRFRADPESAWVAELDGGVAGSVFAARWGSFGFVGPLSVHPDVWDRGIGGKLLEQALETFARWDLRQAGLFTVAGSLKHLGLYQKRGFWPGSLTVVAAKPPAPRTGPSYALASDEPEGILDEIRALTDQVFRGLDLGREIVGATAQGIGDTILVRRGGILEGMAVCHRGAGSEAGSNTCYVKFAAARPGDEASARFERLLDACEAYASASGLARLVAGVNTGRLDAYRRMLARGFRAEQVGVGMRLHPEEPHFDTPEHHVIDDLR